MFCHCVFKCDDGRFAVYNELSGLFYHHSYASS